MEDYEKNVLDQLDFEPDNDTVFNRHPLLTRVGLRLGGLACFAGAYEAFDYWPRHFNYTASPGIAGMLAYAGVACLRQAHASTLEAQPQDLA